MDLIGSLLVTLGRVWIPYLTRFSQYAQDDLTSDEKREFSEKGLNFFAF
jgi:hypothetical protein